MSDDYASAFAEARRLQAQVCRAEAKCARLNPYLTPAQRAEQSAFYPHLADTYTDMADESEAA